jgi:hypothetical protein
MVRRWRLTAHFLTLVACSTVPLRVGHLPQQSASTVQLLRRLRRGRRRGGQWPPEGSSCPATEEAALAAQLLARLQVRAERIIGYQEGSLLQFHKGSKGFKSCGNFRNS